MGMTWQEMGVTWHGPRNATYIYIFVPKFLKKLLFLSFFLSFFLCFSSSVEKQTETKTSELRHRRLRLHLHISAAIPFSRITSHCALICWKVSPSSGLCTDGKRERERGREIIRISRYAALSVSLLALPPPSRILLEIEEREMVGGILDGDAWVRDPDFEKRLNIIKLVWC
jgi:hypothetical protein